jgi:hypothetical protein
MTHDERHDEDSVGAAPLEGLARKRMPGRLLEERTVRALRVRGLLAAPRIRWSWVTAALAASIALFTGGFALGQMNATRTVAGVILAEREQTAMEAALMVQRTGSAHVMALARLATLSDSTANGAVEQGREAAKAALYAAAGELASLAPDDPVAAQIRRYLSSTLPTRATQEIEQRSVVWF